MNTRMGIQSNIEASAASFTPTMRRIAKAIRDEVNRQSSGLELIRNVPAFSR